MVSSFPMSDCSSVAALRPRLLLVLLLVIWLLRWLISLSTCRNLVMMIIIITKFLCNPLAAEVLPLMLPTGVLPLMLIKEMPVWKTSDL